MRRPMIIANWKMNKNLREAIVYVKSLRRPPKEIEVVIAPSMLFLEPLVQIAAVKHVGLASQWVSQFDNGPHTGQISFRQIREFAQYVIIGHSECRTFFSETDEIAAEKIDKALRNRMVPICCIGEPLENQEEGARIKMVSDQLLGILKSFPKEDVKKIIIAYEPLWAIGTGKTPHPQDIQTIHRYIRNIIGHEWGEETGENMRMIYGGSLDHKNAQSFCVQPDIDGFLIGSASLHASSFERFIQICYDCAYSGNH